MLINFDMLQTKMAVVSRSAKHKMLAVNIPNTKVSTENFTLIFLKMEEYHIHAFDFLVSQSIWLEGAYIQDFLKYELIKSIFMQGKEYLLSLRNISW